MRVLIQVEDILSICCVLYPRNNKNSTVIELGTSVVNVLCQFLVKYYILEAFIIECGLPFIVGKPLISGQKNFLLFFPGNSFLRFVHAF